jgi:hypothetical protein
MHCKCYLMLLLRFSIALANHVSAAQVFQRKISDCDKLTQKLLNEQINSSNEYAY